MRILGFVLAAITALGAWAEEYPPLSGPADMIDAEQELAALGSMEGEWVGNMVPMVDRVGANRNYPDGYPIQVTINGEDAQLAFIEDGNEVVPFDGDSLLLFAVEGSGLINYVAGTDTFTETWTISLAQVAPDKLTAIVTRMVHNFAVRRDSPWRVFSTYTEVDLARKADSDE